MVTQSDAGRSRSETMLRIIADGHRQWHQSRVNAGWSRGEFDEQRKKHMLLVEDWNELPEREKNMDIAFAELANAFIDFIEQPYRQAGMPSAMINNLTFIFFFDQFVKVRRG